MRIDLGRRPTLFFTKRVLRWRLVRILSIDVAIFLVSLLLWQLTQPLCR